MLLCVVIAVACLAVLAVAAGLGNDGPAPNSGDGITDGSGFDTPGGPNDAGTGGTDDPFGPAPNAGDGIPDGSSLIPPNC